MVIDDSHFDRLIAKKIIERSQLVANIMLLSSAIDAVEHFKLEKGEAIPEIIFLDISMPDMDGFGFLKKFESFRADIQQKCKIVMLSSTVVPSEWEKAKESRNVAGFISKPLTPEKLSAVVGSL